MSISLSINGQSYPVDLSTFPADITLNTYIRDHAALSGTKFMCLEGGCGVCVVGVTGRHPSSKQMRTWATNSCLTLLSSCDGWEITTIEGLGNKKDGYHPIQRKLAQMNGTQCGYCSPAMVMNMFSLLKSKDGKVTMEEIENSFSGNICRCTGYRPILDAMKSFATDAVDIEDIEDLDGKCPKTGKPCGGTCKVVTPKLINTSDGKKWFFPKTVDDIFAAFNDVKGMEYMLVAGNTAHGVYRRPENMLCFISVNDIDVLQHYEIGDHLELGGNMNLTEVMDVFMKVSSMEGFEYCQALWNHFDLIANVPVRNMGTLAGNLMIKHRNREFPSDVYITFKALDVIVNVMFDKNTTKALSLDEFFATNMKKKLILSFELPKYSKAQYIFSSYKVMPRSQNAHAYVNAAFLLKQSRMKVEKATICFGGIDPSFTHAMETEKLLVGKDITDDATLGSIFETLDEELKPDWVLPDASPTYRKCLAAGLLYKFILSITPPEKVKEQYQSGGQRMMRNLSSGSQAFDVIEKNFPLTKPVMKLEALAQCSGEAKYANDCEPMKNEVYCAFVFATVVGAEIQQVDASEALKIPGVKAFFTAKDIPGTNSFTMKGFFGIADDEEIFVEKVVKYYNQPLGVIVADTNDIANRASTKVSVMYTKTDHKVVATMDQVLADKEAHQHRIKNESLCGEYLPEGGSKEIQGVIDMGTQFHFSMEPQTTLCVPGEDGLKVYCSTQWMDFVQSCVSSMLKMQQNYVQVIVRRLGGGFGGKITRPTQIACACALVASLMNRPARFIQTIESMMGCLGKRYSNNSNYSVKVNAKGKIATLKNEFYEDCGWSMNESPVNIHSTLMSRNCYEQTSTWKLSGNAVITDAPSNTWCRAPGSNEGVAMMESIIDHIASETRLDPIEVRLANVASDSKMKELLPKFVKTSDYRTREADIKKFNKANRWRKKGISVSVMEFPIFYFGLFTATVSVYGKDGSVLITHGGIEMGQGMNTKIAQVAAYVLGIPLELVYVIQSDSVNGANSLMTGGSIGSECCAHAVKKCCKVILERLKPIKEELKNATWAEIVMKATQKSINLIASDSSSPGELNNYLVWGCAATEVEVDILTGNVTVQRVDILEDTGESLNPLLDVGQIEGAFVMGLGFWLFEQCIFNKQTGMLLTNRTWNYKVPGIKDIPVDFRIELLQKSRNNGGLLRSKATGEPAFCLAVSVVFAIRRAIESARKDAGIKEKWFPLSTPVTPEAIMLACSLKPDEMFKLG